MRRHRRQSVARSRDCPARVINLAKFAPKLCSRDKVGGWGNVWLPQQLLRSSDLGVVLETAFDEAWLTLKSVGNKTVKPDELARSVLRASRWRASAIPF